MFHGILTQILWWSSVLWHQLTWTRCQLSKRRFALRRSSSLRAAAFRLAASTQSQWAYRALATVTNRKYRWQLSAPTAVMCMCAAWRWPYENSSPCTPSRRTTKRNATMLSCRHSSSPLPLISSRQNSFPENWWCHRQRLSICSTAISLRSVIDSRSALSCAAVAQTLSLTYPWQSATLLLRLIIPTATSLPTVPPLDSSLHRPPMKWPWWRHHRLLVSQIKKKIEEKKFTNAQFWRASETLFRTNARYKQLTTCDRHAVLCLNVHKVVDTLFKRVAVEELTHRRFNPKKPYLSVPAYEMHFEIRYF